MLHLVGIVIKIL